MYEENNVKVESVFAYLSLHVPKELVDFNVEPGKLRMGMTDEDVILKKILTNIHVRSCACTHLIMHAHTSLAACIGHPVQDTLSQNRTSPIRALPLSSTHTQRQTRTGSVGGPSRRSSERAPEISLSGPDLQNILSAGDTGESFWMSLKILGCAVLGVFVCAQDSQIVVVDLRDACQRESGHASSCPHNIHTYIHTHALIEMITWEMQRVCEENGRSVFLRRLQLSPPRQLEEKCALNLFPFIKNGVISCLPASYLE